MHMGEIEEEDSDGEDYAFSDSDHDNDKFDEADDDYDYDSDDGRLEEGDDVDINSQGEIGRTDLDRATADAPDRSDKIATTTAPSPKRTRPPALAPGGRGAPSTSPDSVQARSASDAADVSAAIPINTETPPASRPPVTAARTQIAIPQTDHRKRHRPATPRRSHRTHARTRR